MIDFVKELERFHFLDMDNKTSIVNNEVLMVADAFTTVLKRLGREQDNTNTQLEELIAVLDEKQEKESAAEESERRAKVCESEKLQLVTGFIEILDQVEDLYRYSAANEYEGWSAQIRLLWENINNSLIALGITRVEGLNTIVNPSLNVVKMTRDEPGIQDGIVLEVLKCGYSYKAAIIRKAEVIVNKKDQEISNYGQNCGDRPGDFDI